MRSIIRRILPQVVAQQVRRLYYPYKIRRMPPEDWPPAELVRALISSGDCVADVGANIGYVTYWLSQWVGEQGGVHSFEPVPQTFALLAHNVRKLGLRNVRLYRAAVTDHEGSVELEIPQWPEGGENLYESRVISREKAGARAVVSAPALTLDRTFALNGETPRVVKIDVEGHEASALRGARELLQSARPAVVVEISEAAAGEVFAMMTSLGYLCIVPEGKTCCAQREPRAAPDAIFLQPSHVTRLREQGFEIRD